MNRVVVLTEPAFEPVTLAQAKGWLRVTNDHSDDDINLLIAAMRRDAENRTGRAFVPRTYRMYVDTWPLVFMLEHPPIVSVDLVTYLDQDGVRQTLPPESYEVVNDLVQRAYGTSAWPAVRQWADSVQITYTAGYKSSPGMTEAQVQAALPATLKLWMQTKIATLFENREQLIIGTIVADLPHDYTDGLLDELVTGDRMF